MIYWDLDGVIRNLHLPIWGRAPLAWSEKLPDGSDFMEYIDNHLELLIDSPPTEYIEIAKGQPGLHLITCQPQLWRENTMAWILKHIRTNVMSVKFVDKAEHKLLLLKDGDILIEDYPMFSTYKQIVLIDHPYNQGVKGAIARITEPGQLSTFLGKQEDNQLAAKSCILGLSSENTYYRGHCRRECDRYPCVVWNQK